MSALGASDRWIKRAGFAAGLAAAVALVVAARVPATTPGRGLDIRVAANLTGRLNLLPVGTIVSAEGLTPARGHDVARGTTLVTNQTMRPLSLQLRGVPSVNDLDARVRVHVDVAGRPLVDTTLRRFRRWVGWNVILPPGRAVALRLRLRLKGPAPAAAYVGRMLDVTLQFKADLVAGRGAAR